MKSNTIQRKFVEKFNVSNYEILTDTGWVDVKKTLKTIPYEVYEMSTENFELRCAGKHILFDSNLNEVFVEDLNVGDLVFTIDGPEHITQIKRTYESESMFDLQLSNDSNKRYYTNGFLSHNTNVGKTLFLCHIATALTRLGYNVLYVSGEMDENLIAQRVDANFLDMPMNDFNLDMDKKSYLKKIRNVYEKVSGKLKIKEYSAGACNALHLKNLLQEYKLKDGFEADVVILDYINLFSSFRLPASAMANSYLYTKSVAEEMRGLAREFNFACVSATQTNRGGADAGNETDMSDTADCLHPDTLVTSINNTKIKLSELKVGDKIKAHDGQKTVTMIHHTKTKKAYKITTKSGKVIICSGDHKFPTPDGRISINEGLAVKSKIHSININKTINCY